MEETETNEETEMTPTEYFFIICMLRYMEEYADKSPHEVIREVYDEFESYCSQIKNENQKKEKE